MSDESVLLHWPNGQKRIEATKRNGHYVGPYRSWTKKGELRESAEYLDDGRLQGEATLFFADEQKLKTLTFENGVVQLPAKRREKLVARIRAAQGHYDKLDTLTTFTPRSQRFQLLWDLHRSGDLPLGTEPTLWESLGQDLRGVTGDDIAALLGQVAPLDPALGLLRVFPFWSVGLDELVMHLFARDPEPLRAVLGDLPPEPRDGLRSVLRRFGNPVDAWEHDMARALADQWVRGLGRWGTQGQSWWRHVLMVVDGSPRKTNICDPADAEAPNDAFWDFVSLFTDPGSFEGALVNAVVDSDRSVSAGLARTAARIASGTEEVHRVCAKVTAKPEQMFSLLGARDDEAIDFVELADAFRDGKILGRDRWEEVCVLLALSRGGSTTLLDRLRFGAYDWHSREKDTFLEDLERTWFPVLDGLPVDAVRTAIRRQLEHPHLASHAIPFAARYGDEELWARVIAAELRRTSDTQLRFRALTAYGLAGVGPEGLPWLAAQIDETDDPLVQAALVWTVMLILKRMKRRPDEYRRFASWKIKGKDTYDKATVERIAALQKSLRKKGGKKGAAKKPAKKKTAKKKTAKKKTAKKPEKVTLESLAAELVAAHGDPVTLDIFKPRRRAPGKKSLKRAGGLALGFDEETWPRAGKVPKAHLFTIDRAAAPNAMACFQKQYVALSVFAASRSSSSRLEAQLLTKEDLRKGLPSGDWAEDLDARNAQSYSVTSVDVPSIVFDDVDEEKDPKLAELQKMIYQSHGYGGGLPMWFHHEPNWVERLRDAATFVLQACESLIPDIHGALYVMGTEVVIES